MLWAVCFYSRSFELSAGFKWLIGSTKKNINDSFRGFAIPKLRDSPPLLPFPLRTSWVRNMGSVLNFFFDLIEAFRVAWDVGGLKNSVFSALSN